MKVLALFLLFLTLSMADTYSYSPALKRALTGSSELKRALAPLAKWNEYPFTVLILGVGKTNSIQHICSGSVLNTDGKATHILTTAYCIQNRTDSDDESVFLRLVVLAPSQNGTVLLGGNSFTEFLPFQTILHPMAGMEANFTFLSAFPNGTSTPITSRIDTNDVGIIRLKGLVNVTGVQPVKLSSFVPTNGTRVDLLGFGGPSFYTLRKTDSLVVVPSLKIVTGSNVPNTEMLFFRDLVHQHNESQAVEVGDEGGPLLVNTDGVWTQAGIAQGTWRVSSEGNPPTTYASLGPAVAHYQDFVQRVLTEPFVIPTDTNSTSGAAKFNYTGALMTLLSIIVLTLI